MISQPHHDGEFMRLPHEQRLDRPPKRRLDRRLDRRAFLAGLLAAALPGCTATVPGTPVAAMPLAPNSAPMGIEEVPYVQTPQTVVDGMLELAQVRAGDRLVDLGSGDGRVVISAARRFGIPGLGVEIDPQLVELSRRHAQAAGVAALARFATQDLFETDLSGASVITLYLLPDVNLALRPRLLRLAPGTRIVSHDWDMADWQPDRSITLPAPNKPVGRLKESTLHLWIVPASFAGVWRGGFEGAPAARLSLTITQQFQVATIDWRIDGSPLAGLPDQAWAESRVRGERATFQLPSGAAGASAVMSLRNGALEGVAMTAAGPRTWRIMRTHA